MNLERLIQMVIRRVIGRGINAGINAGMGAFSRRKQGRDDDLMTPEERADIERAQRRSQRY